jgi:hypothetical protein
MGYKSFVIMNTSTRGGLAGTPGLAGRLGAPGETARMTARREGGTPGGQATGDGGTGGRGFAFARRRYPSSRNDYFE